MQNQQHILIVTETYTCLLQSFVISDMYCIVLFIRYVSHPIFWMWLWLCWVRCFFCFCHWFSFELFCHDWNNNLRELYVCGCVCICSCVLSSCAVMWYDAILYYRFYFPYSILFWLAFRQFFTLCVFFYIRFWWILGLRAFQFKRIRCE